MNNAVGTGIASVGQIEYNGVDLSGPEMKVQIGMAVNLDEAERTQESVTLKLTVDTIVQTADIDDCLNKLSAVGGKLIINALGWKNLIINPEGGGGVRDIGWGPKPRTLDWFVFAPGVSWRLTWTVETMIPFCSDGLPAYTNAIKSLNYQVAFKIDDLGLTTRTIQGTLTIPLTRITQANRQIPDNVDAWRKSINPEIPLGFRRTSRDRTVSADRRSLEFTIVDEEIDSDSAYPEGIVKISIDESIESDSIAMAQWNYTLSGTVTVGRPFPKSWGWDKFQLFMAQRIAWQNQHAARLSGIKYLTSVSFRDKVFGRESIFEVSWLLVCKLRDILKVSGIFKPVEGTSWSQWRTSMLQGPWKGGGRAGLEYTNQNDLIVDLCTNADASNGAAVAKDKPGESAKGNDFGKPDPELSWIDYKCWVELQEDTGSIRHIPLPRTPPKEKPVELDPLPATGKLKPQRTGILETQKRVEENYVVIICGYAMRVAYPIAPPEIKSYGGKKCTPTGQQSFKTGTYANGQFPITWATWRLPYNVESAPADVTPPKVPENG